MKTYNGNVTITSEKQWVEFLAEYEAVTGGIYMRGCTGLTSVRFPNEVTGYISMDDKCSEYLLSLQQPKIVYQVNSVAFGKQLFDSVRKGQLSAAEVFAIENTEQRRVAYERLNKIQMKDLPNYKVLSSVKDDGHGYPMRVVSFTMPGYDQPFKFFNCFCPSEGREYFLETKQVTCKTAKAKSFGLDKVKFEMEW